jgi:hypothetical protein
MITTLISPSGEPSVQDDLWHIATSDASGTTGMKYVFDVWKNSEQLIRVKQFPDPSNGKGYFDASPIIRNEMTYQWFTPGDTVYLVQPSLNGEAGVGYTIRVGEEVSGITTTNLASGNVSAYNFVPPLLKRRVNDLTSKLNKWLSNRPSTIKANLGGKVMIGFRTNASLTLKVDTYNYSNALIASTVDAVAQSNNGFYQVNIGSTAINTRIGSTVIDAGVKYYDVWFNSFDKIRVYLDCNPKYTPINLHFMNDWGMFDTARFDLVSRLNLDVERKGFEQNDYRKATSAVTFYDANNVYHDSKVNYLNKKDWKYKLTMDAPTDAEYQWLGELISSVQVYAEIDGYYYPVSIATNNYEYSKYVNNRLRPLEIEIEMNQQRYSHLR